MIYFIFVWIHLLMWESIQSFCKLLGSPTFNNFWEVMSLNWFKNRFILRFDSRNDSGCSSSHELIRQRTISNSNSKSNQFKIDLSANIHEWIDSSLKIDFSKSIHESILRPPIYIFHRFQAHFNLFMENFQQILSNLSTPSLPKLQNTHISSFPLTHTHSKTPLNYSITSNLHKWPRELNSQLEALKGKTNNLPPPNHHWRKFSSKLSQSIKITNKCYLGRWKHSSVYMTSYW